MTDPQENAKLILAVNQLEARLRLLESRARPEKETEVPRTEPAREDRRILIGGQSSLRESAPTSNPRRYETLQSRQSSLPSSGQTGGRRTAKPLEGGKIEFYCWVRGELGKCSINISTPPAPIKS